VNRGRATALIVALVAAFALQWGFRWARIQGDEFRCQITVESWAAAGSNGYADIPSDERHIGGIYSGDSGCSPQEICYVRHPGPFTTTLERCTGADA